MSEYVPYGMPDSVAYRLKALDKRSVRWPAFDLFVACALVALTYIVVTSSVAK